MKGFKFIQEDPENKNYSGKGFYIILAICILAVGVLGYITIKGINEPPVDEYLFYSESEDLYADESESDEELAPVINTEEDITEEEETIDTGSRSNEDEEEAEDAMTEDIITLPLKYVMPVSGDITRTFNEFYNSATMGDWRNHNGIDIAAEENTQIKAAAKGEVEDVYNSEMMGTTIVIAHIDGVKTVYSNLGTNVFVKKGDSVTAETIIGGVGKTAEIEAGDPSHLHFEAIKEGIQIDPASLIK